MVYLYATSQRPWDSFSKMVCCNIIAIVGTYNSDSLGLKASAAYLAALQVSGSSAYGIFDCIVVRQLFSFLKKCNNEDKEKNSLLLKVLQSLTSFVAIHSFKNDEELLIYLIGTLSEITTFNVHKGIDTE